MAAAGISVSSLVPLRQLDALPDDAGWQSTGLHPAFNVVGPFKAGWHRVQVKLRRLDTLSAERVQADFRADYGDGIEDGPPLERIVWNAELDERHIYFQLPQPAQSLIFQPLNGPAPFRVEAFDIRRLSRVGSLFTAVHHKLKLLREYNCTGRVIRRGLGMLLSGRFLTVWRKLFKALPDTRRFNPESDAYIRLVAGLGRSRVPLTRPELHGLVDEYSEMGERPPVAILLPADNGGAHLFMLAMESVLKQVYQEWELHLVLTGSASADQMKLADTYAERQERVHVTALDDNESMEAALADALDRVEAGHVIFLQPGYELNESAVMRLVKAQQESPDARIVLNQVPPPETHQQRGLLSGGAFRPGAAGLQVNLYRTDDVRALERLPRFAGRGLPIGAEIVRALPESCTACYHHDALAYPISCLTTLPAGPDEFPDLGNPPRTILLTGNICGLSGWDNVVFEVARGLHSLGANIRLNAASHHQADLLPSYLLPARRLRRDNDLELLLAPPHLLEHHPHPPGCIIFTMWESSRLEPKWVDDLNQAALVLVPSQWALESFRDSGVTAPIEVIPLGHDSLTFHDGGDWPTVCTFGTAASLGGGGVRKNTTRIMAAFEQAFPDETDVRLRVKITPSCDLPDSTDPRIEVLRTFMMPGQLADWYRSLSAYVNGSAAEGFGLHLVEAMACGRPVISPEYSAVTEYFDETVGFPISHRVVDAEGTIYRGQWSDLDDADLVRAMRQVYQQEAETRARGRNAVIRSKQFTWKAAGRRLLAALEQHASAELAGV